MPDKFNKLNILAVEDNHINLEIVKKYIEMIGANATTASNGLECLEIYKKSDIGHFDAIFIDLYMPFLDGYSTVEKIRSCNRNDNNIFTVIMSGLSYEDEKENMLKAGIDAYMEKPIDIGEIKDILAKQFSL